MTPGRGRELTRSDFGLMMAVYSAARILVAVWLMGLLTLAVSAVIGDRLLLCPEVRHCSAAGTRLRPRRRHILPKRHRWLAPEPPTVGCRREAPDVAGDLRARTGRLTCVCLLRRSMVRSRLPPG